MKTLLMSLAFVAALGATTGDVRAEATGTLTCYSYITERNIKIHGDIQNVPLDTTKVERANKCNDTHPSHLNVPCTGDCQGRFL